MYHVTTYLSRLEEAGIDTPGMAAARALIDQSATLDGFAGRTAELFEALAADLADGKVKDDAKLDARLSVIAARNGGQYRLVTERARVILDGRARQALADDAEIDAQIDEKLSRLADEVAEATKTLERAGVRVAADALKAKPETAAVWAARVGAQTELADLVQLRNDMRKVGLVAPVSSSWIAGLARAARTFLVGPEPTPAPVRDPQEYVGVL